MGNVEWGPATRMGTGKKGKILNTAPTKTHCHPYYSEMFNLILNPIFSLHSNKRLNNYSNCFHWKFQVLIILFYFCLDICLIRLVSFSLCLVLINFYVPNNIYLSSHVQWTQMVCIKVQCLLITIQIKVYIIINILTSIIPLSYSASY